MYGSVKLSSKEVMKVNLSLALIENILSYCRKYVLVMQMCMTSCF